MSAPKNVRVTLQIEMDLEYWAGMHNLNTEAEARSDVKMAVRELVKRWMDEHNYCADVKVWEPNRLAYIEGLS